MLEKCASSPWESGNDLWALVHRLGRDVRRTIVLSGFCAPLWTLYTDPVSTFWLVEIHPQGCEGRFHSQGLPQSLSHVSRVSEEKGSLVRDE
jgi:hypothetical protein